LLAVIIASAAAWQALFDADEPSVAHQAHLPTTTSSPAALPVDKHYSSEHSEQITRSGTLIATQPARTNPFSDPSPSKAPKLDETLPRTSSLENAARSTAVAGNGQRAATGRQATQACDLSDFVRSADTIYELLPDRVIAFKAPGGDFARLTEVLALSVCPGDITVTSPLLHELAVLSDGTGLRIGVGNGWLSTTAGFALLPGVKYAEISEIFTNRRMGSGPDQSRQAFEKQMAEHIWLQP